MNGFSPTPTPAAPPSSPWTRAHAAGEWRVVQTLHDPEGHHDWVVEAVVDLPGSDEAGEAVVRTEAMRRLGG